MQGSAGQGAGRGAGPRPACLLSVCVNPRLVRRRTARTPAVWPPSCSADTGGFSETARRRLVLRGGTSPEVACTRPQNLTTASQETGDSHTGDSHAGASVQRGAGQSLYCAHPVLHPRQVSLTLSRVWEAAQGTRLPGHLSWLQTETPELSHAHARQRPKPAAVSGSTASSGRRRPALRLCRFQWT